MRIKSYPARTTAPPPGGFALRDLLAVLAVIGMLSGLFFPVLARDHTWQARTFCLQRLNQLARAMELYAIEYREWLPPNPDDANTKSYYNWCAGWAGPGGTHEFNPDLLGEPDRALLTAYLGGDTTVYRCPSDPRLGRYQGSDQNRRSQIIPAVRTVSLNIAVGTNPYRGGKYSVDGPWLDDNHSHTANQTWYCYGKMSDFVRPGPANTFTFIEEDHRSINDACFGFVGPNDPQRFRMIDWPATYHDTAGGVAFADGHAEMHRWVDPRTVVSTSVAPTTQPDNADIAWLAQRASAKIKR